MFSVEVDRVERPDGQVIERETVRHPGAVATVPLGDGGRLWLVRQYRHAVGREMLELPAGILEPGEDPEHCAARELSEEVGLRARRLELVADYYSTAGSSDERVRVYLATGCERTGEAQLDPDEQLDVVEMPFAEALRMARERELEDAKTLIGILAAAQRPG